MGRGLGRGSSCRCNSVHTFSNKPELVHLLPVLCLCSSRWEFWTRDGEGARQPWFRSTCWAMGQRPPRKSGCPSCPGVHTLSNGSHGQSTLCLPLFRGKTPKYCPALSPGVRVMCPPVT